MASVTVWTRLEPHPREGSMQRSLQAQVRDPLWLLARQWQTGEFAGADAGSPVQATMSVTSRPVTHYAAGADGTALVPLDAGLPLEAQVERAGVVLNVRGSAELGQFFEDAVRTAGITSADTVIAAFRSAYPIAPTVPPDAPEDARGRAMRAMLAGRVVDGLALASAVELTDAGGVGSPPLPSQASAPGMPAVLADLAAYRKSLYSEPASDDAWQPRQLDYAFQVASQTQAGTTLLTAPEFPGGTLDWYSFTAAPSSTAPADPGTLPPSVTETFNFLPVHVRFRGMPAARWWEFEEGTADFGTMQPDRVDLATLLVIEFALTYGNDWFYVPLPADAGSLVQVAALVVSDTFGVRTMIPAAEEVPPGDWSMFKISGTGAAGRSPYLMVPPACGVMIDGQPLEDVYFLRDDMAALAWAVEHVLQGPMDTPADAALMATEHDAAPPPPPAPGGPGLSYLLESTVPDNWIPLVPVIAPSGARYLRRGVMARPGYGDMPARAMVLGPGEPFFVNDEVISRAGVRVQRYFRRTRLPDGGTVTWMARRTGPGRGPGWSGLVYDQVRSETGVP